MFPKDNFVASWCWKLTIPILKVFQTNKPDFCTLQIVSEFGFKFEYQPEFFYLILQVGFNFHKFISIWPHNSCQSGEWWKHTKGEVQAHEKHVFLGDRFIYVNSLARAGLNRYLFSKLDKIVENNGAHIKVKKICRDQS